MKTSKCKIQLQLSEEEYAELNRELDAIIRAEQEQAERILQEYAEYEASGLAELNEKLENLLSERHD